MSANWDRRLEQGVVSSTGKAWFLKTAAAWLLNWLATAPTRGAKASLWLNTTNGLPYTNVGTPGSEVWVGPGAMTEGAAAAAAALAPANHTSYTINTVAAGEANSLAAPKFIGQLVHFDVLNIEHAGVDTRVVTIATGIDVLGTTSLTFSTEGQTVTLVGVQVGANLRWRVLGMGPATAGGPFSFQMTEAALAATAAIDITANASFTLAIADAAETNALAAPSFAGQELRFEVISRAGTGTRVFTCVTGLDALAVPNIKATFNGVGDMLVLQAVKVGSDLRWRVAYANSVTFATA